MPKHRQGGKFTSSHTTVIDAALKVVDTANKLDEVSKITLSVIESIRSKKCRLKFFEVKAGWRIVVYGKTCVQTIYVYTSNREMTKAALEAVLP